MGELGANSKIEWTDHTFNPWRGCQHAVLGDGSEHPGCAHCYAEAMSGRNPKALGEWGADGKRVMASDAMWREPLKWNREAEAAGMRARVFCASLADVFEEWTGPVLDHRGTRVAFFDYNNIGLKGCGRDLDKHPVDYVRWATLDDLRRRLFDLIDVTPWLDWLLVTKRPGNVRRMWPLPANGREPGDPLYLRRENVWLLTSVSNQATFNELWLPLAACRDLVPVLGLSAEPLLGPLNPTPWLERIDWVIVGGESGHHARPIHPDWARSLRDECEAAGAAFFFKQWGEWAPSTADNDPGKPFQYLDPQTRVSRVGKAAAGRLLDGREWNEFPQTEIASA